MTLVRFSANFCSIGGLEEKDVGNAYGLSAENKEDADKEALKITRPDGANFVKVRDEGIVVSRLGFELNA